MNEIKKARRVIEANPSSAEAKTLAALVRSLESGEPFALSELYELNYENFNLGIEVLKEWRLDRYFTGKAKLHDLSVQIGQLNASAAQPLAY